MGMGCSQVHLLALTARKHDIGLELEHLSNDKQSLMRQMQEVSKTYNDSLSSKILKWSNNSGVSYVDLSYSLLMSPSASNQNKPYLVTNSSGKVVLDKKYQKFAELISEDGRPGGDYNSNRTYILSQLTGIPESKFDDFEGAYNVSTEKTEALEKAQNATTAARKKAFETVSDNDFVRKFGTAGGVDFSGKNFNSLGSENLGEGANAAKSTLAAIANDIVKNLSPHLEDKDIEALKTAADSVTTYFNGQIDSEESGCDTSVIDKDGNNFKINMKEFVSELMGGFVSACKKVGSSCAIQTSGDDYKFELIAGKGKDDDNYKAYLAAKAAEEAAKAEYNSAVNSENQVFTAEEETQIKFYDLLFNAIAEKGWVYDAQISDNDYLNNMFQNNMYTITTVEENTNYDPDENYDSSKKNRFIYSSDIASNFNKVFYVNDEDARQEALSQYEYEKSLINSKESRIDQRMKNLETEQSAINQMIQGIEKVRNDNVETYFSIFS